MNDDTRSAILAHAQAEYPRECCGVIAVVHGKERYFPCRNISDNPNDEFTIHPSDYAAAEKLGEITAIAHSHIHIPPVPSGADRAACEATGLPWVIVNPQTGHWGGCEPCGYEEPLIGRVHAWNVMDCWTLVRDWYKRERDIELIDVPRSRDFWKRGENPLGDNWKRAGFVLVAEDEELQEGDVLLIQAGDSEVPNHVALYLGDDIIMHHAENRLSTREVYGGWYRKHTVMIVRYAAEHSS